MAIVGAGPAGLAVSARLARAGYPHVVLERERIAWSWRTQRWDSFRLNTPGWMNRAPGKFLPGEPRSRYETMQWLFWQMGGLGPMAGQNNHFRNYAVDKLPYAIKRYEDEVNRLYGVMNKRLSDRPFLAGEYSIADMASYPWVVPHERQHQKIADFPHLKRWLDTIAARPAVKKAYDLVAKINPGHGGIRTAEERAILFGQTAASVNKAAAAAR